MWIVCAAHAGNYAGAALVTAINHIHPTCHRAARFGDVLDNMNWFLPPPDCQYLPANPGGGWRVAVPLLNPVLAPAEQRFLPAERRNQRLPASGWLFLLSLRLSTQVE